MSAAYDWLTLDDDEEIVWEGQPSSESLYGTYIVGALLIPLVGLGLLVIFGGYLTMTHTDYVITTKGVYKKSGILSRSVAEIEYEKVQNTAYSAGPIGRSLGYGTVEISTAGGSGVEMTLRGVEDPQAVQKQLSRRVTQVQGTESEEEESTADVLDEILAELRAIRQSLDDGSRPPTGDQPRDR
ncbi:PH domain-containing protein [Haloarcula halophila]|uniref:PH domain-containing protein n=1 Tax=Haloarcula TaxID=2237 RepID=UPI0023E3F01A|nr:PH domain-containing protein [Halomicroarcula sp. DFY41]